MRTIAARVMTTDARVMTPVVLPVPRHAQKLRHPEPKPPRRVQKLRHPEPKPPRPKSKPPSRVRKLLLHERKCQPRVPKVRCCAQKDRVVGLTAVAWVRIGVLAMTGDPVVTRIGEVVMIGVRVVMTGVAMGIGTEAVDLVVMSRASAALSPLRCRPQSGRRRARRPISFTPMTVASSGKPGPIHAPRPPSRAMPPRPSQSPVWARCPLPPSPPMTVAIVARAARCVTVDRQAPVRFVYISTSVAATT